MEQEGGNSRKEIPFGAPEEIAKAPRNFEETTVLQIWCMFLNLWGVQLAMSANIRQVLCSWRTGNEDALMETRKTFIQLQADVLFKRILCAAMVVPIQNFTPHLQVDAQSFLDIQAHFTSVVLEWNQRNVQNLVNQKLSPHYYGTYTILNKIGEVAYRLDLPPHSWAHPIFHVSWQKRAVEDSTPIQQLPPFLFEELEMQVQPEGVVDCRTLEWLPRGEDKVKLVGAGIVRPAINRVYSRMKKGENKA
ncbi:hypothetical protein H5410_039933 [Solanum commersonii]|uniref:Tf2-1-like SH3-like domain-containing protein n=1 Tax=Solanum commersonii TaxID=4109 RepID=A0A9J5XME2_SOLCO|nr:hypothetical protein H5410_039933 [Solanum commersonii]